MIQNGPLPTTRKIGAPLIIDPDSTFLNSITSDPHFSQIQPIVASTGRDAQLLLSDGKQNFSGVFVNPKISHPGGLSVIRCARLNKPATPICLLNDIEPLFSAAELKGLGIQKQLQKPVTLEQIMSLIAPQALVFNSKWATNLQTDTDHPLDQAISAEDGKFSPIRATDFLSGAVSHFDVYIRLNSNKYIKILQAGDKFLNERVQSYLTKGVKEFFIKKESQENYLSYCDQLSTAILNSARVPVAVKAAQVLNHGEETLKFLSNHGISDVNLQYASEFLGKVQKLTDELNPGKHPLLKGFLSDLVTYDHGVGVTVISSLIIPFFNIASLGPVDIVGMAALFHDIGLFKLGFKDDNPADLSAEETQRFRSHPIVGSEILNQMRSIKPAAIQAVLQHHERRNKKGYPHQIGVGSVSMVAEIIGISDEFFSLIQRLKKGEKLDLATELKTKIFDGFSPKLVAEFKKIFLIS